MSLFHKKSFECKVCPRMPAKAAGIVILSIARFLFVEILKLETICSCVVARR